MIEADIPYLETHLNVALSLYLQRINCVEQIYSKASVQQAIEKRLLIHLHVLASTIDDDEPKPKDDSELFVYVSRRLLSSEAQHKQEVLMFAKEILVKFPYPKGLVDAFTLFYNDDINQVLVDLFDTETEIRSTIISIWHLAKQQLPVGLLNQSELQTHDAELQSAVLIYNAEQENIGLSLFQKYYGSLVNNVQKEKISSKVIQSSLWAGMLRNDIKVIIAIRRAIELESDSAEREKYLRLAALNGNVELLAIFSTVAEANPELGSYLIALLGNLESVKILFTMLQNPQHSILIIPAWQLITGEELKVVPRMSLVDVSSDDSNPKNDDDVPMIADLKSAQEWMAKNIPLWDKESRYIHGQICNHSNLLELSYDLSGKVGKDIFDLLSLNCGGKVSLKLEHWVTDRIIILDSIAKNSSVNHG